MTKTTVMTDDTNNDDSNVGSDNGNDNSHIDAVNGGYCHEHFIPNFAEEKHKALVTYVERSEMMMGEP